MATFGRVGWSVIHLFSGIDPSLQTVDLLPSLHLCTHLFNRMNWNGSVVSWIWTVQKLCKTTVTHPTVIYTPKLSNSTPDDSVDAVNITITDLTIDWLINWLIYRFTNWTFDRLKYWPIDPLNDWPIDQWTNCSIDRFTSHYQGITKINDPKWEVGEKVWEKSTIVF